MTFQAISESVSLWTLPAAILFIVVFGAWRRVPPLRSMLLMVGR